VVRFVAGLALSVLALGCRQGPSSPSGSAVVSFGVVGETFRVRLVGDRQIDAARAAQAGGRAYIPNGRIAAGTEVNVGWSWHLEDVEFAEATVEVCDGLPSAVEREGVGFGGGRYCPWSARVLAISPTN
jgi:hypothetical protein